VEGRRVKGGACLPFSNTPRPHGITATHQDQVNADLLAFIKA
jgi:hypothetical protein